MSCVVALTLANVPMTPSKYTLPPPIYLPSSGGYTSSRFVEDVSVFIDIGDPQPFTQRLIVQPLHQRVFPHRKYSFDEDGRLVCRTRNANREPYVPFFSSAMLQPPYLDLSRPKPYDRPQRPSDRVVSPGPVPDHQLATQDLLPTKQIDPSTFARLFQQLVPVAVNEPLAFESRATAICASLGLDPATAADIIDSVKQQFPTIRDQEITYVSKPSIRLCR